MVQTIKRQAGGGSLLVGDVFRHAEALRRSSSPLSVRPPPAILGPAAYIHTPSAFRPPKSAHSDPSRRSPLPPPPAAVSPPQRGPVGARRAPSPASARFIFLAEGHRRLVGRARTGSRPARALRVISLSHATRRWGAGGPGAGQAVPVASQRRRARARKNARDLAGG